MEREVTGAGEDARRGIHRVKKAMKDIQAYLCPYDSKTCDFLNTTTYQLGNESVAIKQFMHKNGHFIDTAISLLYITNLVVVSANLAFIVAALGELPCFYSLQIEIVLVYAKRLLHFLLMSYDQFSFNISFGQTNKVSLISITVLILLRWNLGFVIVIFFCWILTSACWVLTGVNFFLHNFAEDTCTALQSFLVNPKNSSLSSLLPCENLLKSKHILIQIGQIVHDFVAEMNSRIVELPKELGLYESSKYNSLIGSPKICDPFSGPPNYTYVQEKCPNHTIPIGQLPHILEKFTCSNNGSSSISGCLPESYYSIAYAYIRSIQDLIGAYPDLDGLIDCSFVINKLSDAESRHCRAFKVSTRRLWISMLCLSTAMAALVLLWIAKAFIDRGRRFSLCSIAPNRTQL